MLLKCCAEKFIWHSPCLIRTNENNGKYITLNSCNKHDCKYFSFFQKKKTFKENVIVCFMARKILEENTRKKNNNVKYLRFLKLNKYLKEV